MFELTPFARRYNGLMNYNPFRQLEELEKNFFSSMGIPEFRTDIQDKGDHYLLQADLPGFEKQDIHVDLEGQQLTISAQRHSEYEQRDEKERFVRCERSFGSYCRSFDISGIEANRIQASYENGVLTLHMPKKAGSAPDSRRLEIQ